MPIEGTGTATWTWEAARWIDEANRQKEDDLSGTRPAWGGWHEPVVSQLLLREAEELLKGQKK